MAIRVRSFTFTSAPLYLKMHRMLEMQAILIACLEDFEFSPAPGDPEIIRSATAVMSPMYAQSLIALHIVSLNDLFFRIKGQPGRAQLPLKITSLS